MRTLPAAVMILLLSAGSLAGPCPDDRECVGLVLAGGGARGAAHVGVIEVMEELNVPVDFIVGTSMGAIIGGMYASGMSPEEMREQLDEIDWDEAFNDSPPRRNIPFRQKQDDTNPLFKFEFGVGRDGFSSPRGLVAGQKLNFILAALLLHTTDTRDFDDLPIPFRAIAVDLVSGEVVVQSEGDLPTAIRASMAYPVFFTPVEVDDMLLIDGGVLRNLPTDIAIDMGADRMIAVDVGSPFSDMEDAGSAFKVARRTISVMTREGRKDQRRVIRESDLLIVPDLEGVTAFENFDDVGLAVERGVEAASAMKDDLRDFAVDEATFAAYIERHRAGRGMGDVTIDHVEVTGLKRVSPKRVTRRIESQPGTQIDVETLNHDLGEVYRIGEFEQVGFGVRDENGEKTLEITASEKSWGPWFYRLGASAAANLNGRGEFTGNLLVTRPNLNPLGGEFKAFLSLGSIDLIDTDFYQPIEYTGSLFASPRFYSAQNSDWSYFVDEQERLADTERHETGFDLGTKLFSVGELRIGALNGKARVDPRSTDLEMINDDVGGWRLLFNFDGLDNANFPRSGTTARLELFSSRDNLGADREYERLFAQIGHAWKMGAKWTQVASASFGTDLGSDLPFYDAFRIGGFLSVSGLRRGELLGSRMAQASLITFREVGKIPGLLGGDLYLGGSLEGGNAWPEGMESEASLSDLRYGGSLWGGVDTLFGPIYVGWGLSEGGRSEWTFILGRIIGTNARIGSPRLGG